MKEPERKAKPLQFACFTLPWEQLRSYPDIGDWMVNEDNSPALICAADTGDDISNAGILLHEIIEALLCWVHGVKEEDVTEFDQNFFVRQANGEIAQDKAPGDDPSAPYHTWHLVAERFEREFIVQAGMMWNQHEVNCNGEKLDAESSI